MKKTFSFEWWVGVHMGGGGGEDTAPKRFTETGQAQNSLAHNLLILNRGKF